MTYVDRIYSALRRAQGGEENFDQDDNSVQSARCYAAATLIAEVVSKQALVKAELRPSQATELLANHELDYGLAPTEDMTVEQRRAALAAATLIPNGATESNVTATLTALLDTDFIAVRLLTLAEADNWDDGTTTGLNTWHSPPSWWQTTNPIYMTGTSFTVGLSLVAGSGEPPAIGDKLTFAPMRKGLTETVEVVGVSGNQITAVFTKGHETGEIVTSVSYRMGGCTNRIWIVRLTETAARDAATRQLVHRAMERLARATDDWVVTSTNSSTYGPFRVGGGADPGLIGITCIGTLDV
jgi:hypothetical protein